MLYFYPKDDTSGCTKQACSFRDNIEKFKLKNTIILGVSSDDSNSHNNFISKYNLPFTLLIDEKNNVKDKYKQIADDYDKSSILTKLGIIRMTFLIDKESNIIRIWKNVKVDGHIDEILNELNSIEANT